MITNRRTLITGLISLVAAPAIIKISNLMPVKAMLLEPEIALEEAFEEGYVYFPSFDGYKAGKFVTLAEAGKSWKEWASIDEWLAAKVASDRR